MLNVEAQEIKEEGEKGKEHVCRRACDALRRLTRIIWRNHHHHQHHIVFYSSNQPMVGGIWEIIAGGSTVGTTQPSNYLFTKYSFRKTNKICIGIGWEVRDNRNRHD